MGVIGPSLRHQRIANSNYVVTPSGGRYINNDVVNENIMKTVKVNGVENMKKLNMELNPLENGVMLIWEGIEECAEYKVKLYARKNEPVVDESCIYNYEYDFKPEQKINLIKMNIIDEIEVERTKKHLAIKDLAQLNVDFRFFISGNGYRSEKKKLYDKGYFVEVIAEDRHGNEIAKSDLINFAPGKKYWNSMNGFFRIGW